MPLAAASTQRAALLAPLPPGAAQWACRRRATKARIHRRAKSAQKSGMTFLEIVDGSSSAALALVSAAAKDVEVEEAVEVPAGSSHLSLPSAHIFPIPAFLREAERRACSWIFTATSGTHTRQRSIPSRASRRRKTINSSRRDAMQTPTESAVSEG
ncbi:hypothetical protein C8R47DRAFT_1323493 [Mycena vitilis]|nr:hypothetical protein C8R47DRAFT_1323493 [Mycena vitilis]